MKHKWLVLPIVLLSMFFVKLAHAEPIWVDVRTAEEKVANGIEGDLQMSHDEILAGDTSLFPDKDAEIHLYCRSGRRSGLVTEALKKLGYTNVTNEGSVEEAREVRQLTQ